MCLSNGICFKFFMMFQPKNLVPENYVWLSPDNQRIGTQQHRKQNCLPFFWFSLWIRIACGFPKARRPKHGGETKEESGKWKRRTEPEGPTPMAAGQARRWIRSFPPHNWYAFAPKIFARGFTSLLCISFSRSSTPCFVALSFSAFLPNWYLAAPGHYTARFTIEDLYWKFTSLFGNDYLFKILFEKKKILKRYIYW